MAEPMTSETRSRIVSCLVVLVVIPIGLFARAHRAGADPATLLGFLSVYTGDTLWPIMFYFMAKFCSPQSRIISLLVFVLGLTLTLEFGQLVRSPTLDWLRKQPGIGFVLGSTFIWSDVICCTVGAAIAVAFDVVGRKWTADARNWA